MEGERDRGVAILRGLRCKCPNCGKGKLFTSYLKVTPNCAACNEELHHQEADDLPPYLTIVVVGHIIVPLVLYFENHKTIYSEWNMGIQAAIWLSLSAFLALALLPPLKGAVVGLQWALKMHGFGLSQKLLDTNLNNP